MKQRLTTPSDRRDHAKITTAHDSTPVPPGSQAPGAENKYAAGKTGLERPGMVKSTALVSPLASLVLAALKTGPASGASLAERVGRRRQDVMAACQELRRLGHVRRQGHAWELVPAGRCEGKNSLAGRCGREAALGSRFCILHQDQADVLAPAAKPRTWFDDICDRRGVVFTALGFQSFPSVNDLANVWPRVRRLYNSEHSQRFEATWNWLMDYDLSFRETSLAAGDLFDARKESTL